ncbi:MAG: methyltransferase domain-containing protein [Candidatus Hodarchaeota archaeon]
MKEYNFKKYKSKGAYHWFEASNHLLQGNPFLRARYKKCITFLKEALNGLSGKKVLDSGCGDGALTYRLFLEGSESYRIDPNELAIKYAKHMHILIRQISFVSAQALSLKKEVLSFPASAGVC